MLNWKAFETYLVLVIHGQVLLKVINSTSFTYILHLHPSPGPWSLFLLLWWNTQTNAMGGWVYLGSWFEGLSIMLGESRQQVPDGAATSCPQWVTERDGCLVPLIFCTLTDQDPSRERHCPQWAGLPTSINGIKVITPPQGPSLRWS